MKIIHTRRPCETFALIEQAVCRLSFMPQPGVFVLVVLPVVVFFRWVSMCDVIQSAVVALVRVVTRLEAITTANTNLGNEMQSHLNLPIERMGSYEIFYNYTSKRIY